MVHLLEQIRDLTRERNEKLESLVQLSRQRYEEAQKRYEESLQRQKEARERAVAVRRRFLWVLAPLLLLAIGFLAYIAFLVIPLERSQDRRAEEYRMMVQSNMLAQPH